MKDSNANDTTAPANTSSRGMLTEESLLELPWKTIPNSPTGAKQVTITLANGFGLMVRTNPNLTNQYKIDIYTAYPIAENSLGKPEILAYYMPYEYMLDSAIIVLLAEFQQLDPIDHETEGHLFITHSSHDNAGSGNLPKRAWYDLAGKIEDYLYSVTVGIGHFLDKIGKGKGDDDDQR